MADGNAGGSEGGWRSTIGAQPWLADAVLDTLRDPVLLLDGGLRVVAASRAFYRTFGVTPGEVNGKQLFKVRGGIIRSEALRRLLETVLPRATSVDDFPLEFDLPETGHRFMRVSARALPRDGQQAQLILLTMEDVTEQERVEAERRSLAAQLLRAQKMESIGRLAGGVAHDFNNLLTIILGTVDLALAGLREGDPLAKDLRLVRDAAGRGADLTRHLLAFSRRQVFQPRVLNLNEMLGDMEPMLRRLLGEDIRLDAVLASDLGNVRADQSQLEQVVMNLIVNSRDAMPNGGVLTIETANAALDETYTRTHLGSSPGSYVMLAVTDTGVGMDESTKEKVFEPFFTTKPAGSGTGLGLSTVYGIVKQSGGNVWVYSELGLGTTFKIYLPLVAEPVSREASAAPADGRRGMETILLVEDDSGLREVARRVLEGSGYTVLAAGTPGEALLAAEHFEGDIHLVLTDVVMPVMRGPELAQRILESRPQTKVLYASGYTENAIVRGGELKEGTDFLSKPFDAAALLTKVREVLDAAT